MAIVALQHTEGLAAPPRDLVAQKIIELAIGGERDPERLCDRALMAARPAASTLISDPNPPLPALPPALPDS